MTIPDVKPGEAILASDFNKVKRLASRKFVGDGVFETDDFVAIRSVGTPGGMAMRFVAIAGVLPSDSTKIGVYPITRNDAIWSLAIGQDDLPETTEVMRVWPHMVAADFIPFLVRTGEDDGTEPPFPFDYDVGTGVLDNRVTICPAYKVDGEWWVHNTARMSWANPASDSIFSSCGKRSTPELEGTP